MNAQTRKGPTPAFVPPCKGTGCGSEGVGINRGGLPDRGRRAEVKGGMTPLLYAARDGRLESAARLLVAAGADLELGDGERHPAAADGRCSTTRSTSRASCCREARERQRRRLLGPVAALGRGRIPQPGHEQQRPGQPDRQRRRSRAGSGLDPRSARRGRRRQRAHARGAAHPALALLAQRRVVGGLHRADAVPARGALGRHDDDAAAACSAAPIRTLPTLAGTTPLMAAAGVNWVVAQTYTESPAGLDSTP